MQTTLTDLAGEFNQKAYKRYSNSQNWTDSTILEISALLLQVCKKLEEEAPEPQEDAAEQTLRRVLESAESFAIELDHAARQYAREGAYASAFRADSNAAGVRNFSASLLEEFGRG